MEASPNKEEVDGYLVDLACLRKYSQAELLGRARTHTRECAMMAHCVESGYGLVTDDGRVIPLDIEATPLVYDALRESTEERGLRMRAYREKSDAEMKTTSIVPL